MAKFIFKMQNILSVKERLEGLAKTEYAEYAERLNLEEEKMKRLLERRREYELQAQEFVKDRLNIPEIRHINESIVVMKELIKQQGIRVRIAERNLDAARNKLNAAMQQRKIYEKLKENAFEEFKLELNEAEKKEIDELVSFSYNDNNRKTGE